MSRRDDFWEFFCDRRHYLWLLLMVLLFFLILDLYALVFGDPGSAAWVVAQLNLILIVGTGAVAGGMYWNCVRRANKRY